MDLFLSSTILFDFSVEFFVRIENEKLDPVYSWVWQYYHMRVQMVPQGLRR